MKELMLRKAMEMFLSFALARLTRDNLTAWINQGITMLEDAVKSSKNETDDVLVLPICAALRAALLTDDEQ